MGEQNLKEPTIGFKRQAIKIFFDHISESSWNLENYLGGFRNQGYTLDCFYWMNRGLEPTPSELEGILSDKQYGLTEGEIKNYMEVYKKFYNPKSKAA